MPGQIITVTIESFSGRLTTGEDCAVDFLDDRGNIVLRWGMRGNAVQCNSYDAREQKWGTPERSSLPEAFHAGTKPLPTLKFEMKADSWDISIDSEEPTINFRHRATLNVTHDSEDGEGTHMKVIAPPVAVKVSDNCILSENAKDTFSRIQTILFEDAGKDTWQESYTENKLMKLKLEFWSHDTKTGLGMLDGEVKESKGMLMDAFGAGLGALGAGMNAGMGLFGGKKGEDKAQERPEGALAIEDQSQAAAPGPSSQ